MDPTNRREKECLLYARGYLYVRWHGCNLIIDFFFGLPMMGWARHSLALVQRDSEPPRTRRPSRDEIIAVNLVALDRAKPSRDQNVDAMAWEKTKAEFVRQIKKGPYYNFDDLPKVLPDCRAVARLLNRFRHLGNAQWRD